MLVMTWEYFSSLVQHLQIRASRNSGAEGRHEAGSRRAQTIEQHYVQSSRSVLCARKNRRPKCDVSVEIDESLNQVDISGCEMCEEVDCECLKIKGSCSTAERRSSDEQTQQQWSLLQGIS